MRRIRDELDTRVLTLIDELLPLRQLTLPLARARASETIGTFALVFAGCGAIMVDEKTERTRPRWRGDHVRARDHGR